MAPSTYNPAPGSPQVDQVFAITQYTLNQIFNSMFKKTRFEPDQPMKNFSVTLPGTGTLSAELLAPEVELLAMSQTVFYRLYMKSGDFEPEAGTELEEFHFENWLLVFQTRVGYKTVPSSSKEYQAYAIRAGLPGSTFTVAQIFLDLSSTNSTSWEPKKSKYDSEKHQLLEQAVPQWLDLMEKQGCNILGYTSHIDDPSDPFPDPTYSVTHINFWNYPHRKPTERPSGFPDDCTALCFLMGRKRCSIPRSLPWEGTLDDVYVMNKALFDDYIWHHARTLLAKACPIPGFHGTDETPLYLDDKGAEQRKPLVKTDVIKASAFSIISMGMRKFATAHYVIQEHKISHLQGKDILQIQGRITTGLRSALVRRRWNMTEHLIRWQVDLVMTSVQDGALTFESQNIQVVAEDTPEGISDDQRAWFQNTYHPYLKDVLAKFSQPLSSGSQNRLFLPGAGSFHLLDPRFTASGGIMTDLEFSNNDPPPLPPSFAWSTGKVEEASFDSDDDGKYIILSDVETQHVLDQLDADRAGRKDNITPEFPGWYYSSKEKRREMFDKWHKSRRT